MRLWPMAQPPLPPKAEVQLCLPPTVNAVVAITLVAITLVAIVLASCVGARGPRQAAVRIERGSVVASDGHCIEVMSYSPTPSSPVAVALFAHGGCFHDGDCTTHPAVSKALAQMGIASVSSSYRQGANHPHPAAQQDLTSVAKFARVRWPSLPFGVVGSSSGGWHALMLARTLPDVRFCVALAPVAHPAKRLRYLEACMSASAAERGYTVEHTTDTARSMILKQTSYWRTEEAMAVAGDALLEPPDANHRVPTLLVIGNADKNVPVDVTLGVQSWAERTVVLGDGIGHELQNAPPESNSWSPDVDRFLAERVLHRPWDKRAFAPM